MKLNLAFYIILSCQLQPSASRSFIAFIASGPSKLKPILRRASEFSVYPALDQSELEFPRSILAYFNERLNFAIIVISIPELHLIDAPLSVHASPFRL